MKKLIAALIMLTSINIFASEEFTLTERVATCFILTDQAVKHTEIVLGSRAQAKCEEISPNLIATYRSYLDVKSLHIRNLCGGIEASRVFACIEKN